MKVPALSIIGWSGVGKTTLLCQLLPELSARGVRVAVVKHSSDAHALHKPGSDTERLERAGASPVGFSTPSGLSLHSPESDFVKAVERLAPQTELLLVEGWKDGPLPKIEVWRKSVGPLLSQERADVLAVVTDDACERRDLPRFSTAEVAGLALFITRWSRERREAP